MNVDFIQGSTAEKCLTVYCVAALHRAAATRMAQRDDMMSIVYYVGINDGRLHRHQKRRISLAPYRTWTSVPRTSHLRISCMMMISSVGSCSSLQLGQFLIWEIDPKLKKLTTHAHGGIPGSLAVHL